VNGTGAEPPEVGTELPPLTVRFTRETLVRYAGAAGDFNPIHYSAHAAETLGLPGVVAHGMLSMGTALRVATDWAGPGARVLSYGARFPRPVVVPDDGQGAELELTGRVTAVEGSVVTVTIEAVCAGQKVLGAARAEIDLGAAG
jgi:acyl dehydratase